jgi:hypothetical protein
MNPQSKNKNPRVPGALPPIEDPLFNDIEASRYLGGVPMPKTLERWRRIGVGPKWVKLGRRVKYRKSDLDAYIDRCTRSPRKRAA